MAKDYFADLEQLWRQQRKTGPMRHGRRPFEIPNPTELRRSRALRGPDFVNELIRLAVMTRDKRFGDALLALIEHQVVDRKFNFLPWEPPADALVRARCELDICRSIYLMRSRGRSLRRACAELAAHTGWPAASFAGAVKDIELLYKRHELEVRPNRPIGELEKACSRSIPTTADN